MGIFHSQYGIRHKYSRVQNPEKSNHINMLLCGTGESGKTTFVKQLLIINDDGFSNEDRIAFSVLIYQNIFIAMQTMIEAMTLLKIEYSDPRNNENAQLISSIDYREVTMFEETIVRVFKELWADAGILESFERRREYHHLTGSAGYFLEDIDRIGAINYVPSEQDILHIHKPTKEIFKYRLIMDNHIFTLVDSGGYRQYRKIVIDCHVATVIFIAALSEYDENLFEAPRENRMTESVSLFNTIMRRHWDRHTSFVLFLNKNDLLEKKIMNSDLVDYFPEYDGPKQDAKAAQEFILDMFLQNNKGKTIKTYLTNATDTENIRIAFEDVKDAVLDSD